MVFRETVVARGMPEPCKFPFLNRSLYHCANPYSHHIMNTVFKPGTLPYLKKDTASGEKVQR